MAKYIRTNDGVYRWDCPIENLIGSKIIKQADNLVDLRDEIVLTIPLQKPQILEKNVSFEVARNDILNNNQQTVYDLYCCIWVKDDNCFPKLVPYAKMNMYGELRLI